MPTGIAIAPLPTALRTPIDPAIRRCGGHRSPASPAVPNWSAHRQARAAPFPRPGKRRGRQSHYTGADAGITWLAWEEQWCTRRGNGSREPRRLGRRVRLPGLPGCPNLHGGTDINVYLYAAGVSPWRKHYANNPFNAYYYGPLFALNLVPLSIPDMPVARVLWMLIMSGWPCASGSSGSAWLRRSRGHGNAYGQSP